MRTLKFIIDGQNLTQNGDFDRIIKGTKGYLHCEFRFENDDWNGCRKVAVFESRYEEYAVAIGATQTCLIPDEITDNTRISLYCVGVKDGYRIVTNKVEIEQEE